MPVTPLLYRLHKPIKRLAAFHDGHESCVEVSSKMFVEEYSSDLRFGVKWEGHAMIFKELVLSLLKAFTTSHDGVG